MLEPDREIRYPNLKRTGYRVTSRQTIDVLKPRYNCVGWAACGVTAIWWQPGSLPGSGHFWPDGVLDDGTLESYIKVFEYLGYHTLPEKDDSLELLYEKVAIYAYDDGEFSHVCYQVFGGWASKLGEWQDIEHKALSGLESDYYGRIHVVMKRRCGLRGFLARACFNLTAKLWPVDRESL